MDHCGPRERNGPQPLCVLLLLKAVEATPFFPPDFQEIASCLFLLFWSQNYLTIYILAFGGDLSGDASIATVNTKVTSDLGSLPLSLIISFFLFPVGASGIRLSPFYFNFKCILFICTLFFFFLNDVYF